MLLGSPIGGETTFTGLPHDTYCVKVTTVPAAYALLSPVTSVAVVGPGETKYVFLTLDLKREIVSFMKLACLDVAAPTFAVDVGAGPFPYAPPGCVTVPGTKHFSVQPYGDPLATPIAVTFDVDSVGRALPLTFGSPHTVTDVDTGASVQLEVVAGAIHVVRSLVPMSALGTGTIEIRKFVCQGDPADSTILVDILPAQIPVPKECVPSDDATFTVYPYSGETGIGPLDPGTYEDIPVTPTQPMHHLIVETGSGMSITFPVEAGKTTALTVLNYEAVTGSLFILKVWCDPETDGVEFHVLTPVSSVDEIDQTLPEGCWAAPADFLLYPFGDTEGDGKPIPTNGNTALIPALPVTDDETGPHLLVEVETGASVEFDIVAGKITPIVVTNWVRGHPTPPSGEQAHVTTLPNTGTGQPGNLAALFAAGALGVLALLAAGDLRRRRTR